MSLFGGLLLLTFKPRGIPYVAAALLVIYCIIIGVSHSFELTADNLLARVDTAVLGDNHIYHLTNAAGERIGLDPEGLLSTIPCVAHVLLGAMAGRLLMTTYDKWQKMNRLFVFGSVILLAGFLLDYAFPINKTLWSASYTLVTCGLASIILALLIGIIDINGYRRWSVFFESFGANPLFIYCLSALFVYISGAIRFTYHDASYNIWSFYYRVCMVPLFGETLGSLMSALTLVGLLWLIAHPLYRKKIYIKI